MKEETSKGYEHSNVCRGLSFLTQFALFSGECWFLSLSVDLYQSLTNPFSSYKINQQHYSFLIWSASFALSISLAMSTKSCQGTFSTSDGAEFCWIDLNSPLSSECFWGYFMSWVIAFYLASVAAVYFAFLRLRVGLDKTYETRKACVYDTFRMSFSYLCYGAVTSILYASVSNSRDPVSNATRNFFAYLVACRGFVDACVWFYLHDITKTERRKKGRLALFYDWLCCRRYETLEEGNSTAGGASSLTSSSITIHDGPGLAAPLLVDQTPLNRVSFAPSQQGSYVDGRNMRIEVNDDDGSAEYQDIDLTPQLNLALRQEVLHFVTEGIRDSVVRWAEREKMFLLDPNSSPYKSRTMSNEERQFAGTGALEGDLHAPPTSREHDFDASIRSNYHAAGVSMSIGQSLGRNMSSILTSAAEMLGLPHAPGEYGEDLHATAFSFNHANADVHYDALRSQRQSSVGSSSANSSRHNLSQSLGASHATHRQGAFPPPPAEVVFDLDEKHRFRDYRPATFNVLRALGGMNNEKYADLLSQPARERLTEGSSGAFMFYCGDVIVKTISSAEALTLLNILDAYCDHIRRHPNSLIVRFFGLHSLTMFGREFSFVVMRNQFPPEQIINERYDIKGSWVGRNAGVVVPGKRTTCRHCSEFFVVGDTTSCPVGAGGGHEPSVVLKDNDLFHKIRLRPEDAYTVIETLSSDSDALCAMGITDYSLLLGVRNHQYDVDVIDEEDEAMASGIKGTKGAAAAAAAGAGASNLLYGARPSISIRRSNSETSLPNLGSTSNAAGEEVNATTATRDERSERMSINSCASTIVTGAGGHTSQAAEAANHHMTYGADGRTSFAEDDAEEEGGLEERDSDFACMLTDRGEGIAMTKMSKWVEEGFPARSVVAPAHYYIGIVDCLQTWSWRKRLEYFFRVVLLRQPREGVSCADPVFYKTRFQNKMSQVFEHSLFVREVSGSWSKQRILSAPRDIGSFSEFERKNSRNSTFA